MAPVPGRRSFVGPTLVLLAVLASLGFIALQLGSAGPAVGAASPAPSQPPAASLLAADSAGRPGPSGDGSPSGDVASPPSSDPSSPSASQPAAPQPPTADPSAPPTSAPPPALTLDPSVATRLQARLDTIRAKTGIPGVSAAIILADGSTWTGTSGLGYVKGKRFVTPETVFAIASASKTYLSAVTLQLVDEGRLGLDTPVLDYLPDQPIDRRITVRMLLDHTSGLSDFFLNPKIDKALQKDEHRRWTSAEALGYMRDQVFKPGTGWHYSNTNYVVLGLLAERVTGLDLGSLFHQRLFGPLALTRTYYQPTDEPTGVIAHGYRVGTTLRPVDLSDGSQLMPFTSVVTAAAGAGAIATTATDLARWGQALYGGRVVSDRMFQAMVADAGRTDRFHPYVRYGLGVQLMKLGGHPTLGHSGRLLGFRSDVRYLRDTGLSIAVLTNQSRTDPRVITRALLSIVAPPPAKPAASPKAGSSTP